MIMNELIEDMSYDYIYKLHLWQDLSESIIKRQRSFLKELSNTEH